MNQENMSPVPAEWQHVCSEMAISPTQLSERVKELAETMSIHYSKLNPLLVVVLKGSYVFASDLSRALPFEHQMEFIRAKSYEGMNSTGKVNIQGLESVNLQNRHVIVVEDIIDTGLTLQKIYVQLKDAGAASVKCCTLLLKETARRHKDSPQADYVAFHVPDKFLIGYGLDYNQRFRHLPFVGVFKQS